MFVDLLQKEIDAWVKFIYEKAPSNTEEAPQILAVVSKEEKLGRLKVINILIDFIVRTSSHSFYHLVILVL